MNSFKRTTQQQKEQAIHAYSMDDSQICCMKESRPKIDYKYCMIPIV